MKIGLTGTNGFIGHSVKEFFHAEGIECISLDSLTKQSSCQIQALPRELSFLDWVLHFGAKTDIQKSHDDSFDTYSANIHSTMLALQIALKTKATFLFMSSYVYGPPQYLPIDEKHPIKAVNPYMGSKIIGEKICRQAHQFMKLPIVILRGFNIYGDVHRPGRLISDLIQKARKKESLELNDPAPVRDYLYIKDFNQLLIKICTANPLVEGENIYNVGSGESHSNLEVAQIVNKITRSKLGIINKSKPRKNDIIDCTVDISSIKSTFSWKPRYSLVDGLSEILNSELCPE